MRRVYRAEDVDRERVQHVLTAALEAEPDLEFAWLHGSFLAAGGFHDVDVGVHLNTDMAAEVRFRRALDLAVRLDREAGFPGRRARAQRRPGHLPVPCLPPGAPAAQPERRASGRCDGTDGPRVPGHGAVAAPGHHRGVRRVTLNPDVVRRAVPRSRNRCQRLEALAAILLDDFLADRDAQDIASTASWSPSRRPLRSAITCRRADCAARRRTMPAASLCWERRVFSRPISRNGCSAWRSSATCWCMSTGGRLPAGACRDAGEPGRSPGVRGGGRCAVVSGAGATAGWGDMRRQDDGPTRLPLRPQ